MDIADESCQRHEMAGPIKMMNKILLAYDGSEGADLALNDMAHAGFPAMAEGKVLCVADVWLPAEPRPGEESFPEDERFAAVHKRAADALRDATEIAEGAAELLRKHFPNWKVSPAASADSPAWGILAEAKSWKSEWIVIGSHGRTPLEKLFVGSVSYKVAAEAACSVRV
ncbi:MAG TPA: universal stress protein, partial [Verrucomicrobiae bacterium]|nr:universal stress protein [Verrucomicrobiae bacterium]